MAEPLVVRLPNGIGDVIMALPGLDHLHRHGLDLICLGRPYIHELLAALPYRVEAVGRGRREREQYRASGARYGLAMRSSLMTAWRMHRAGLKVIGYRAHGRSPLLWRGLRFERKRWILKVEEYHRLAQFMVAVCAGGYEPTEWERPPFLELPLAEQHRDQAAALLGHAGIAGPYLVACPMAGHRRHPSFKSWPHFADLVERLVAAGEVVLTCPGPGEEERCRRLAPGATMLSAVGLGAYMGILAGASRVVSNDTGPMHMAAALGTPTLGIHGDTPPERYSPWAARATQVGTLGHWPTLDEVWEALEQLPGFRRD